MSHEFDKFCVSCGNWIDEDDEECFRCGEEQNDLTTSLCGVTVAQQALTLSEKVQIFPEALSNNELI